MKNGLYCSAGYDYVTVLSNGNVSPCTFLMLPHGHPELILGNLFDEAVELRKQEFFRCPPQSCPTFCDRNWSRKQVWKDGEMTDVQNVLSPETIRGERRKLAMVWIPTWKCNYSCSYCTLPPAVDERKAEDWVSGFGRFFDANGIDGGLVMVTGGEPLFYKDVGTVFHFLAGRNFALALTTNLSMEVWSPILRSLPPDMLTINCSLHPSDKHFRWDQFRGRVLALKAYGYTVAVNFVGHPEQVMLATEYRQFFESHGVPFQLIPMGGEYDGMKFATIEDYPRPMRAVFEGMSSPGVSDSSKFKEGKRVSLPVLGGKGQPAQEGAAAPTGGVPAWKRWISSMVRSYRQRLGA